MDESSTDWIAARFACDLDKAYDSLKHYVEKCVERWKEERPGHISPDSYDVESLPGQPMNAFRVRGPIPDHMRSIVEPGTKHKWLTFVKLDDAISYELQIGPDKWDTRAIFHWDTAMDQYVLRITAIHPTKDGFSQRITDLDVPGLARRALEPFLFPDTYTTS